MLVVCDQWSIGDQEIQKLNSIKEKCHLKKKKEESNCFCSSFILTLLKQLIR